MDPVKRLEILFMVMTERLMELRSVFGEVVRLADSVVVERRPAPVSRGDGARRQQARVITVACQKRSCPARSLWSG